MSSVYQPRDTVEEVMDYLQSRTRNMHAGKFDAFLQSGVLSSAKNSTLFGFRNKAPSPSAAPSTEPPKSPGKNSQ